MGDADADLSAVIAVEGQIVAEEQPIGGVGDTGVSTAPHLHYEQRYRGRAVRVVFDAWESPTPASASTNAPAADSHLLQRLAGGDGDGIPQR